MSLLLIALLTACAPESEFAPEGGTEEAERTYQRLTLTGQARPFSFETTTYTVTGARPFTRVDLWGSRNLQGRGIVFPGNGLYLDVRGPTLFRQTATSDANGVATFSIEWRLPVGARVQVQAMTPVAGDFYVSRAPIVEVVAPICGDGRLAPAEACDDGNVNLGDGCDDQCQIECPDADADTVCDIDDVCPNGDDTVDTDGDGIPDACEVAAGSCPCFDAALLDASAAQTTSLTWIGPGVYSGIEFSVEGWGTGADPIYWRARTGSYNSPPPFIDWCDYGAPAPMSQGSAFTQWLTPADQQACADVLYTWGVSKRAGWPAQCADADSDTVCDVDDVCPNGDDRVDTDSDGTPDACEQPAGSCPCFDAALLTASAAQTTSFTWAGPGMHVGTEYSVEGWGTGADPVYWRARTGTFNSPPPFVDWCDYGAPAPMSQGSALTQWLTPVDQQVCADVLYAWGAANGAGW